MNSLPWLTTEGSALPPLVFTLGFLFLSLALGRRVLKLCDAFTEGTRSERGIVAACLGAGTLQFLPFALGVAGLLNVTALRSAALVVSLLALPDLRAVAKSACAMTRSWRPEHWPVAWALALSPALFMTLLIALTPSLDADGLAYHLTVPKRWMTSGHLDYLPTYPFSNAPMGMDLLFAWAMAFAGDSAAKCIHLLLGSLAGAAIYLAGRRLRGPMTGAVPATLFLVGPAGVAPILGYAYVDGGAALATASAALAWLIWFQTSRRGFLRVAALLAGIAVSFKISTVLFPLALAALSVLAVYERLRDAGQSRALTGAFSSLVSLIPFVVAPSLPWFIRAFVLTGNPFFPVLARHIPSRDLSAEFAIMSDNYNRYWSWGNALGRNWTLEQRAHILLGVGAIMLVLGVFARFKLRTPMARGTAVIVTITAIAQLSAAGLYFRYSLPLAAALMLPLAAPFERWFARRSVMLAWIAITLVCSAVQVRRSFLEEGADFSGLLATVAGVQDRRIFLEQRLPPYPLYTRINSDLPANARILLSGHCGGFYIDRTTFCAENFQNSLRFKTWEEFIADVRRLGITHIITASTLATGGPPRYPGGADYARDETRVIRQILTQHARTLQTASDLSLFEIDRAWLAERQVAGVP